MAGKNLRAFSFKEDVMGKKMAKKMIGPDDSEVRTKERKDELVTVTRGQLDEVVQALYGISTIGAFLDFANISPGDGGIKMLEYLVEGGHVCEPISHMARILKEKANAAINIVWEIESGETVGHKEAEVPA